MKKKSIKTALNIIFVAINVTMLFLFTAPLLKFNYTYNFANYDFYLDGLSLLVNNSKAMNTNLYDTIVLDDLLFQANIPCVLAFVLIIFLLAGSAAIPFIDSKKDIDKYVHPAYLILNIIVLVLLSLVHPLYHQHNLVFSIDYGLIVLITFSAINIILTLIMNLITFNIIKIKQD